MKEHLGFIISFLAPFLFFRIIYAVYPKCFQKHFIVRRKTGLNIHHDNLGSTIILLGVFALLIGASNFVALIFFGLGLGLITDPAISNLIIKSDRSKELVRYEMSFNGTVILFAVIVIMVVILYLLF